MVQVNTSSEEQKSGVAPEGVLELAQHIIQSCPSLHLEGLMTIGAAGEDPTPFFAVRNTLLSSLVYCFVAQRCTFV